MTDEDTAGVLGARGQMDAHETAEARVLDPDEYTQKRRIKDVLDARRSVIEDRRALRSAMLADQPAERIGRDRALAAYRVSLENYLAEAEPLFVADYAESGLAYWREADLGTQTIRPPEQFTGGVEPSVSDDIAGIVEIATPVTVEFTGLKSILTAPRPLAATFTATVRAYDGTERTRAETRTARIEWNVLDTAYRATNRFLAEIGMDLDPEDESSDIIRNFDMSGDEPTAEYGKAEYNGDPDL